MPFELKLEPGEELVVNEFYKPGRRSWPFAFAVSNKALFLPIKKSFAIVDPWYFRRVPLSDVRKVEFRELNSASGRVMGIILALLGSCLIYVTIDNDKGFPVYGILITALGLFMPFLVPRRHGLIVELNNGSFIWRPPIMFGPAHMQILAVQERILQACKKVGLPVFEGRQP